MWATQPLQRAGTETVHRRWQGVSNVGLLALLLGLSGPLPADQVVLQPVADATLFEAFPDNNLGAASLAVGTTAQKQRSRALIRFDVAGPLPRDARIEQIRFAFTVTKEPPTPVRSTFHLHRVLRNWGEGKKAGNIGAPAEPGDATWVSSAHGSSAWTAPGGKAGDDYVTTPSASLVVSGEETYLFPATAEVAADVQLWFSQPESNFGWIVISDAENTALTAKRLGSRETPAQSPSLTIVYSAVAPTVPPQLRSLSRSGNQASFEVVAETNLTCTVQFSPVLPALNWLDVVQLPAPHAAVVSVVDAAATNAARFYRVRSSR